MKTLEELLRTSGSRHKELCPRQVLGVRMGMLAGALLDLDLPQADKRLLAIVETDGCATDGIAAATGCAVGRRTMRIEDFGKVAATFVDTATERAVRVVPRIEARALAREYAPAASSRWQAQLAGYQRMPDDCLLRWEWVALRTPVRALVARDGVRVLCEVCQEEIIKDRQVLRDGVAVCRACAGQAYYRQLGECEAQVSMALVPCL
ncbi:MAG: TraR/DksA C4-type zinc finger protein [Chloroflexota bacterium]|nr:TraR/DksA C4-type zinc finger protein [Chloroflexota bacterium]